MTDEKNSNEASKDENPILSKPSEEHSTKQHVSISSEAIHSDIDRRKRKVSRSSDRSSKSSGISHVPVGLQENFEKQIRKTSNVSTISNGAESGSNCFINLAFQHGPNESKRRASVSSYNVRLRNYLEAAAKAEEEANEQRGAANLPFPRSWWYVLCMKCRGEEVGTGWEPSFWPKLCPYPFCPSYRQIARLISLFFIGFLIWGMILFFVAKDPENILESDAAPGGPLFNIALICLTAHFVGWIFQICTLPSLLGMLITGIVFQNALPIKVSPSYAKLTSIARKVALVVLLTRAGLDLEPAALKKLYLRVITLGIVPWLAEAGLLALLSHYFLNLPWMWAMFLGCIIGAVAPAVVVPCLFRLRNKGYGVAKGIPTLIIAVAGINDALSVAFFGLFQSIMFYQHPVIYDVFVGPVSIACGLGFGIIWGFLAKFIPEKDDPFVIPLRVLMLFCGGMVAVLGSEKLGVEGAGPLGVIAAAFASIYFWSHQGWNIEDNPVATSFEIFWMICQPILFSLTGAQIELTNFNLDTFSLGAAFIVICFIVRMVITGFLASGSSLNLKEKLFVSLAWIAKASVQAVLAPAALESARRFCGPEEIKHAETLVTICVIAMLITVPIGAISISSLGTRLLTKTKHTIPNEGWRRSARPSLRDISIIDEEMANFDDDENRTLEKKNGTLRSVHETDHEEQEDIDVSTPVFTNVG